MSHDAADPIFLVEVTGYTDASTSQVYRYASRAYYTQITDTPSEAFYEPRVLDAGSITRSMFEAGQSGVNANPAAEVSYGFGRLANLDGALDALFDGSAGVSFRERFYRVLEVQPGAAYSTAKVRLNAVVSQCSLSGSEVTVGIKDRLYELASPHLTATYGGTNALPAGVDGTDDIKGKLKPKVYGKVLNASPVCVNTSKLIYQISARALQSVDALREGGVVLTAGATYPDQATMESTAPSAGQYRAWLAGGMVRLGTSPQYRITIDATADTSGNSTAAQLIKALAIERGFLSGDVSATDVAALDAANSAVLGIFVTEGRSTTELMDDLARSVGASYWVDMLGILRMRRFGLPGSTASVVVADWNCSEVEQVATGEDVPTATIRLKHSRYWDVQRANEVYAAVTDAVRADLAQQWRVEEYSAAPSPNPHKRTLTAERETCFVVKADATAEALRLHGLTNAVRRTHILRNVELDEVARESLDLGSDIELRWPRYGFDTETGAVRAVIAMTTYLSGSTCDLTVWGS